VTLWLVLTACAALAAAIVAIPFLRHGPEGASVTARAHAFSRQQLTELEADVERGLIGEEEAQLARKEIERRVLAAASKGDDPLQMGTDKARIIGLAIATGWVVVGGAMIYAYVGRPDLPGTQAARTALPPTPPVLATTAANAQAAPSVDDMVSGLAARLKEQPDDVEGWRMLGWSYFQTGKYQASVDAYAKAVELDASDPVILSVYGEAIVRSEGGEVSDRALGVFHQALALDPNDPRARFFQGMALEQRGDPGAAITLWLEILDTAPADADWAPGLRDRISELSASSGIELEGKPGWTTSPSATTQSAPAAQAPRGPSAADIAAAQSMSATDRQAMIQGMVEGLAARLREDPNDIAGWERLIRSYTVLNDTPSAVAALGAARDALGADSAGFAAVASAAAEVGIK